MGVRWTIESLDVKLPCDSMAHYAVVAGSMCEAGHPQRGQDRGEKEEETTRKERPLRRRRVAQDRILRTRQRTRRRMGGRAVKERPQRTRSGRCGFPLVVVSLMLLFFWGRRVPPA